MRKITFHTLRKEYIEAVDKYLGNTDNKGHALSLYGYAFYYNQIQNGLELCDAHRYANLNTIMRYDVGIRKFKSINSWFLTHGYDLKLITGSDDDKKKLESATKEKGTCPLDFSKFQNMTGTEYTYTYFDFFAYK